MFIFVWLQKRFIQHWKNIIINGVLLRYNILATLYIFHMDLITIQGAFVCRKKPIAWSNQGFVATFNARNIWKIKSCLENSLLEMIVIENLQQRACNCVVITSLKDFNALQWRLIFFLQHWYLITTLLRYFRLKRKNVLLKN